MAYVFQEDKSGSFQVYNHLVRCNLLFNPPLDTRVDLYSYANKIVNHASRFEAWLDGTLVGLVAVYFNDASLNSAFITNVSVEQAHQGKGIAKKLLLQSIKKAKELTFRYVYLEVSEQSAAALKLYQALGFSLAEETLKDKLKLVLHLKPTDATTDKTRL